LIAVAAGCATQPPVNAVPVTAATATEAATTAPKAVPAAKSNAATNITGTVATGSKFSKVKPGMQFKEVNDLIGTPNRLSRKGKRWTPFYFGSDVVRLQASYKGEGCLTYTGHNQPCLAIANPNHTQMSGYAFG
jgi:hypothetical protein